MTAESKMEGEFAKDLARIFCRKQAGMGKPAAEAPPLSPADSTTTADDVEYFAPCIASMFLDKPEGKRLICVLCFETPLDLVLSDDPARDTDRVPIQFPCGHFFGFECFRTWVKTKRPSPHCPVCKRSLLCGTCSSITLGRRAFLDALAAMPKTIPQIREVDDEQQRPSLLKCTKCHPDGGEQRREEGKLRTGVGRIFREYRRITTASPNLTQQKIEQAKQGLEKAAQELSERVREFQRFARWQSAAGRYP